MADTYTLSLDGPAQLFPALRAQGTRIVGPALEGGRVEWAELETPERWAADRLQGAFSAKGLAFPKVERLLTYSGASGGLEVRGVEPGSRATVLWGARPCEARGFAALDAVFNWDSQDSFFNARRAALTVVAISCAQADDACFCASVGGGPSDAAGSDLLLTATGQGYFAEVSTEKGRALVEGAPAGLFVPCAPVDKTPFVVRLDAAFDAAALTAKLPGMFVSPLWDEQALACLGCGACAFVCPACGCFDIQDETEPKEGRRMRCWDSCGFALFTKHASGHNPRETQGARWRQRVLHKFSTYPQRYGLEGCVGCGKCTRACPVDMNLKSRLIELSQA
jgi:ferredoxin